MPWLVKAVLAVAGALGVRALFKHLLQVWLARSRRALSLPRVQHTLLLSLPELREDSEDRRRFDEVLHKMNTLPGIKASFHRYGTRALAKEALLQELGKPDLSLGMTHCLLIVADDLHALRRYLHGSVQTQELSPLLSKHIRGVFVTDSELAVDLAPGGREDPLLQVALLRFQPHVTRESQVYRDLQEAVAEFGNSKGVRASLRHMGHGGLSKDQLVRELQWADRTNGITHCLTIAADSLADLKALVDAEVYSRWLQMEVPHLRDDGQPAALVFHAPLELAAAAR